MLRIVLLTLFSLSFTQGRSLRESSHYHAVVVEYAAEGNRHNETALQIISRNWEAYSRYIAMAEGADIVVFPECGLTTTALPAARPALRPFLSRVPAPAPYPVPCDAPPADAPGASQVVRNASCAARRHGLYLVLNLPEEAPCAGDPRCPPDGAFIYNTNVAFDRSGALVARYRKFHLFHEAGFDAPPAPALAVFDTDFGVRFATFICFDILFEAPSLEDLRTRGVTDIAYSTAWFSELPFLTAVATQAGWAHATNATLLAAGLDRPANSNTGSGVYWGDGGAISAMMRREQGTRSIIVRVPKRQAPSPAPGAPSAPAPSAPAAPFHLALEPPPVANSEVGHLKLWQDDLRAWATVLLPLAGGTFAATLCPSDALCCHVDSDADALSAPAASPDAAATAPPTYFYRLGAFDGVRSYARILAAGVQACAVFACVDAASLDSCGRAEDGRAPGLRFRRLELSARGLETRRALQMPSTLEAERLLPLEAPLFRFRAGGENASMALTRPLDASLLTFGVYTRVFARDRPFHDALPFARAPTPVDDRALAAGPDCPDDNATTARPASPSDARDAPATDAPSPCVVLT